MEVDLTKELCDQPLSTDQSAAVVTTYEARGRLHEVQTEHRTVESLAMFAEHLTLLGTESSSPPGRPGHHPTHPDTPTTAMPPGIFLTSPFMFPLDRTESRQDEPEPVTSGLPLMHPSAASPSLNSAPVLRSWGSVLSADYSVLSDENVVLSDGSSVLSESDGTSATETLKIRASIRNSYTHAITITMSRIILFLSQHILFLSRHNRTPHTYKWARFSLPAVMHHLDLSWYSPHMQSSIHLPSPLPRHSRSTTESVGLIGCTLDLAEALDFRTAAPEVANYVTITTETVDVATDGPKESFTIESPSIPTAIPTTPVATTPVATTPVATTPVATTNASHALLPPHVGSPGHNRTASGTQTSLRTPRYPMATPRYQFHSITVLHDIGSPLYHPPSPYYRCRVTL